MTAIKVAIELANNDDLVAARHGKLEPGKVRRFKTTAIVNPKVSGLMLPMPIAKRLGIRVAGKIKVEHRDGRIRKCDRVEGVYVEILGRHGLYRAHLESKRAQPVIGRIVLNDLDFLVDSGNGKLYPRAPQFVTVEIG